jgi:hypothetical protein
VNECMDWIRTNENSLHDLDVPAVFALANGAQIPLPNVNIPRNDMQKSTEEALEWIRNRNYINATPHF